MPTRTTVASFAVCIALTALANGQDQPVPKDKVFRAGAFAINISPLKFPVIVNGGMTERTADKITDPLHARCLVLDDGTTQIAMVVVDSCMVPRHLLDEAKDLASKATGIPTNRMLISATHTHTAPSVHGCLGSDVDEDYARFLPPQIAKGIAEAHKRLEPARIGWAVGTRHEERRLPPLAHEAGHRSDQPVWRHQGRHGDDAPGAQQPQCDPCDGRARSRCAGDFDPDQGRQAAGDLFGLFAALRRQDAARLGRLLRPVLRRDGRNIGARPKQPSFMAALANATSGDMWLMDYTEQARRDFTLEGVAQEVAAAALEAFGRIEYRDWVPLAMEESLLHGRRAHAQRGGSRQGQRVHEVVRGPQAQGRARGLCPRDGAPLADAADARAEASGHHASATWASARFPTKPTPARASRSRNTARSRPRSSSSWPMAAKATSRRRSCIRSAATPAGGPAPRASCPTPSGRFGPKC